jgi:hypothetical protein
MITYVLLVTIVKWGPVGDTEVHNGVKVYKSLISCIYQRDVLRRDLKLRYKNVNVKCIKKELL